MHGIRLSPSALESSPSEITYSAQCFILDVIQAEHSGEGEGHDSLCFDLPVSKGLKCLRRVSQHDVVDCSMHPVSQGLQGSRVQLSAGKSNAGCHALSQEGLSPARSKASALQVSLAQSRAAGLCMLFICAEKTPISGQLQVVLCKFALKVLGLLC